MSVAATSISLSSWGDLITMISDQIIFGHVTSNARRRAMMIVLSPATATRSCARTCFGWTYSWHMRKGHLSHTRHVGSAAVSDPSHPDKGGVRRHWKKPGFLPSSGSVLCRASISLWPVKSGSMGRASISLWPRLRKPPMNANRMTGWGLFNRMCKSPDILLNIKLPINTKSAKMTNYQ